MKRFLLSLTGLLSVWAAYSQVQVTEDKVLERQIVESGFIHSPLPLEKERSFEATAPSKKVLLEEKYEGSAIRMKHATFTGQRAVGPPYDIDYATYGNCTGVLELGGRNLEKFNRLAFDIYAECEGARVLGLYLSFPGAEAAHLMHLENGKWNRCWFEISDLERSNVNSISFHTSIKGRDMTVGDTARFVIDNIRFQQVEAPERTAGWEPMKGRIIYSTSGYLPLYEKIAVIGEEDLISVKKFELQNEAGKVVYKGKVQEKNTSLGRFGVIDFSDFNTEGEYRIVAGDCTTQLFRISDKLWDNSQWRVLNFMFCQRCGYPVPGIHTRCHDDLMAVHDGKTISYGGGWHDAGDLSQQTLQTADVAFNLLEAYQSCRDSNPILAARLLEEARWGIEFMLKCRFGDGWHASSVGLLIWTDNIFGSLDDIKTVRTQNYAFDNYLYAAYEAYAAMILPDDDPAMKAYLEKVAREDFEFAETKFEDGFDKFVVMYEHQYCTSKSQFMATISWAASQLFKLTGDITYAYRAAEAIEYTLECQRTEPLGDGTEGFFYRDNEKRSIVHHIHHSREQVFMQALSELCATQPDNPEWKRWSEAIRLHGEYLKGLMVHTKPYGMIPSGVYNLFEYNDTENFNSLHLFAPEDAQQRYSGQVRGGVQIEENHFVKRFPVWFNLFNGNTAVNLTMGKSAAICGKFLKDKALLDIAAEQLYWTVGKNPFGQSLIYGEGHNYSSMSSFSSGEITGEMPVGIRTIGEEDVPYWPLINSACYKEVWMTSAGKWLSLVSEF